MLDWAVVGFQKCGTTSLRYWLRGHPQLACAPLERPAWAPPPWGAGWTPAMVVEELERVAEPGQFRGVVAPGLTMGDVAATAKRLKADAQDCRIISIERDPIERAWSAWVMQCQRGEERSFREAVGTSLRRLRVSRRAAVLTTRRRIEALPARDAVFEYVEPGDYDRHMSEYEARFEYVLRLHTQTLDVAGPRILDFLGIDAAYAAEHPMPRLRPVDGPRLKPDIDGVTLRRLRSYYSYRIRRFP